MISQAPQAVLFDADGVLVSPDPDDAFWARGGDVAHAIRSGAYKPLFARCLVGEADLAESLPAILAAGGWAGTPEEFLRAWLAAESRVDPRLAETIRALRRRGHPCWLASNQERHRAGYMAAEMGFASLFDGLLFSCDLGAKKPDRAFYRSAERAVGREGRDILFFDDTRAHVEAARERGWVAELYATFEAFEAALALRLR